MQLNWIKCTGNVWCQLETVNLEGVGDVAGVYLIWHGGLTPRWVRVGQGIIKERLAAHRTDPQILAYRQHGLFVTWASVAHELRDGIEAYLALQCAPLVGERFPQRIPVVVNLPQ